MSNTAAEKKEASGPNLAAGGGTSGFTAPGFNASPANTTTLAQQQWQHVWCGSPTDSKKPGRVICFLADAKMCLCQERVRWLGDSPKRTYHKKLLCPYEPDSLLHVPDGSSLNNPLLLLAALAGPQEPQWHHRN